MTSPSAAHARGVLALTGVTGTLGGLVLEQLADLAPIAVVRDAARAPAGVEVRVAAYADADECCAAFTGVDTLLLVSASESPTRRLDHATAIAAAAEAGVGHVVYTSFQSAAPDATFTLGRDHHEAEQALRASGMRWTFLRDGLYQESLVRFADADGVVRGPAGDGRIAAVAQQDIADVAAAVLRDPAPHAGETYTLTGPEAPTMAEAIARGGIATGRTLRYEDETVEDAYAWRRDAWGAEDWQLDAWVSTYTAIADGSLGTVSPDVERVLGRPARSIEQTFAS
ncbi:SDR family oxidoreductase [Agrococcus jejuensis]|uniref:SDR family oxidoreductase n=1 Tax=Agrococcus jejuensis TaxID=399736 RepID=UPI00119F4E3E|nr:SDR family oxidoreductase [Agrococcus jejuensis]